MEKWEYMTVNQAKKLNVEYYNELGKDGWELVAFDKWGIPHFKRKISD